jgi:D-amino peptidase
MPALNAGLIKIMNAKPEHILIICDIEGSSGCFSYEASSLFTDEWVLACNALTQDVNAVVTALFEAGVKKIIVKDYHRTGYNLFTSMIDPRAEIISGYRSGCIPGIGDLYGVDAVLYIGMHAASGSGGFLAHTMTSRIAKITAKKKIISEFDLFTAALAQSGIRPIFFSGCPIACGQAKSSVKGIQIFSIDKTDTGFDAAEWRKRLAQKAAASLANCRTSPRNPEGPFEIDVEMKFNKDAAGISRQWKLKRSGSRIYFSAVDYLDLFNTLIKISYLSPLTEKIVPFGLPLYNLFGKIAIVWARRRFQKLTERETLKTPDSR